MNVFSYQIFGGKGKRHLDPNIYFIWDCFHFISFVFFLLLFIYLIIYLIFTEDIFIGLRERRRDIDKERSISEACLSYVPWPGIEVTTQVCALIGNWTRNLSGAWEEAQPTEPPSWVRLFHFIFKPFFIVSFT